jgi:cellulose biosynthesis protein BcsQ
MSPLDSDAASDEFHEHLKGKSLSIVSGKGGPGKTVLTASFAYILRKAGKKVLLIDTDFQTRGASYFIIGDMAEKTVLDIRPESTLSWLMREDNRIEEMRPAVIRRAEGEEYHIIFSDPDLCKGGSIDAQYVKRLDPEFPRLFYRRLKAICEKFNKEYDYILLDTRGGYDFSSAIPALAADGFVVVLEADKLSINQTNTFLQSIDSYRHEFDITKKNLEGFICNKWIYKVDDDLVPNHLRDIFGGIPFGNIPFDTGVIQDYGNKIMPLWKHPAGDFAHYTFVTARKLFGPELNWNGQSSAAKFDEVEEYHRRRWIRRRRKQIFISVLVPGQVTALGLAAATYLLYAKTHLLSGAKVPFALALCFFVMSGIFIAAKTHELLTRMEVTKGTRRTLAAAVALVFIAAFYVARVELPTQLNNSGLLGRIAAQQENLTTMSKEIADLTSQLDQAKSQLRVTQVESSSASDISNTLRQQNVKLENQLAAIQNSRAQASFEIAKLTSANSNLQVQVSSASDQMSRLQAERDKLASQVQEFKTQLQDTKKKLDQLQSQVDSSGSRVPQPSINSRPRQPSEITGPQTVQQGKDNSALTKASVKLTAVETGASCSVVTLKNVSDKSLYLWNWRLTDNGQVDITIRESSIVATPQQVIHLNIGPNCNPLPSNEFRTELVFSQPEVLDPTGGVITLLNKSGQEVDSRRYSQSGRKAAK